MRDDLLEWENIEGVVHGLVEKSGWSAGEDVEGLFSAERDISAGDDHLIASLVAENKEALLFMVRLEVCMTAKPSDDRLDASIKLLERLLNEAGHALTLQSVSVEGENPVFEFTYAWKCDSDLKLAVTLPALCEIVEGWALHFAAPVMAMAPHAVRFLVASSASEEEFWNGASRDLNLLSTASVGCA